MGLPHHPKTHLEGQILVFRCGPCRRLTSDMTLPSAEVRHQRFAKNRDIATSLATPGLSCARAGKWAGCVKSAVGKRLLQTPLAVPELPDSTPELDGLWTRTSNGRTELKVIRDVAGTS